jgi:DNA-binding transcriptional LysR family regulator
MSVNWDDLKVVLAVSRAGSLTRAAELLGVDQSTCGRRLAALEAALGAVLFVRSNAGLSATEAGEAAISRALEVELRMDRLAERLSAGPDGPAGLVRIVGGGWALAILAERALPGFTTTHPRLDLRLVAANPRAPARPEATIGLWFEAPIREPEFAVKLCRVPYAVYARRGLDWAAAPWVSHHDEESPRLMPTRMAERLRGKAGRSSVTSQDTGVLLAATRAGVGPAILPMRLGEACPELERLQIDAPAMVRTLSVHLHPDTVQSARVQAVLRWLRSCADDVFGGEEFAAAADSE